VPILPSELIDIDHIMQQFAHTPGGLQPGIVLFENLLNNAQVVRDRAIPAAALDAEFALAALQTALFAEVIKEHVPTEKKGGEQQAWQDYSRGLRVTSQELVRIATAPQKDGKAAFQALNKLGESCSRCHQMFRDREASHWNRLAVVKNPKYSAERRVEAIRFIGENAFTYQHAIPELVAVLTDERPEVRRSAVVALERLGVTGRTNIAVIDQALEGTDPPFRYRFCTELGNIDPRDPLPIAPLAKLLQHPELAIRLKTVEVLGRLGDSAKAVSPELAKALQDKDLAVRLKAVEVLGRIA
jgi:hypothetical protein